jgi:hypothetical protein
LVQASAHSSALFSVIFPLVSPLGLASVLQSAPHFHKRTKIMKYHYIMRSKKGDKQMNTNRNTTISKGEKHMNTNPQNAIKEGKMKITASKLIRWSGLSAMVAGVIFVVIQPIHPADVLSSVNTSTWAIITSFKTAMSFFGLLGIAGIYARQVEKTGWLGLAGYLLVSLFYALQMCFSFIEPLILPLLATEAPKFVESVLGMASGAGGPMNLGALAAVYSLVAVLYMLGCLLFGIAIFRARILPRLAAVLLALSGPLSVIMVTLLPHQLARLAAVPMGIAVAWLGYALWSERREPAAEPLPGLGSPQPVQTGAD